MGRDLRVFPVRVFRRGEHKKIAQFEIASNCLDFDRDSELLSVIFKAVYTYNDIVGRKGVDERQRFDCELNIYQFDGNTKYYGSEDEPYTDNYGTPWIGVRPTDLGLTILQHNEERVSNPISKWNAALAKFFLELDDQDVYIVLHWH